MPKAFCISYDLKAPGRDYSGLYAELQKTTWWHFLESTWLIATNETSVQVWNRMAPHIDPNDRLIVIEVRNDKSGWLTQDAWDWINANVSP